MNKIQDMLNKPYTAGFKTDIESYTIPKGLDEDTVRLISAKKEEPEWMLEFRLKVGRCRPRCPGCPRLNSLLVWV